MESGDTKAIRILGPEDAAVTVEGAGDVYRFLATGEQTDGAYFIVDALVPPGGGPPPHIQTREEEGFYVLEGTVTFLPGDGTSHEAGPGTQVHVPRGVLHSFRNETDQDARMLFWFAPAGIERMFVEMAADPDRFLDIAAQYGVQFPGLPPGTAAPPGPTEA